MRKLLALSAAAACLLALAAGVAADVAKTHFATKKPLAGAAVRVATDADHGTGVYLGNGLTLTAAHVVHDQSGLRLRTDRGQDVEAVVLWENQAYDLALVQTEPLAAASAPLACRAPVVGEEVQSVGNPLGLEFVSIRGRVAAGTLNRSPWSFAYLVDMTVVPGMSGGPLYDRSGSVIGIVTGVAVASRSLVGIGYIVPSSAACTLLARS